MEHLFRKTLQPRSIWKGQIKPTSNSCYHDPNNQPVVEAAQPAYQTKQSKFHGTDQVYIRHGTPNHDVNSKFGATKFNEPYLIVDGLRMNLRVDCNRSGGLRVLASDQNAAVFSREATQPR